MKHVEKVDSAVVVGVDSGDVSSVAGGSVRSSAFERGVVLSEKCSIKGCVFPSAEGQQMCRHHQEFYCMEARELLDENVFRFFIEESFSHVSQSQVALSNALIEQHLSIKGRDDRWEHGWHSNRRRSARHIFLPRTNYYIPSINRELQGWQRRLAKSFRSSRFRIRGELRRAEAEYRKEQAKFYYQRLHAGAKWTPIAERLAALNVGEDFFVPNENPKDFARVARMGLGANSASKYIPKSIITRPNGVLIRRVEDFGHWSRDRWGSYAEVKRQCSHPRELAISGPEGNSRA